MGQHVECDAYFCKGSKSNEENMHELLCASSAFQDFQNCRVANHASSLLHDTGTNKTKSYNIVVNRLVGGKRINFSSRSSYQIRCLAADSNFNNKQPSFYPVYRKITKNGKDGKFTERFCSRLKVCKKIKPHNKLEVFAEDKDYGKVEEDAVEDKNLEDMN